MPAENKDPLVLSHRAAEALADACPALYPYDFDDDTLEKVLQATKVDRFTEYQIDDVKAFLASRK